MSARLGSARTWRIALGVLAVLSYAAAIPLTVMSHQYGDGVVAAVIGVPCAPVGWLVARRQPENPIGWLFLATAILMALTTAGGDYGYLVYRLGHHFPLASAGLAIGAFWGQSLLLFGVAVALFPDGRMPNRFWRVLLRIYYTVFAILILATCVAIGTALAAHPVQVDSTAGLTAIDHPTGWFGAVQGVSGLITVALSLAFIARQGFSWRRADGDRRQQLKWLASGAAVSIGCLLLATAFSTPGDAKTPLAAIGSLGWFGVAALPLSIGVAILRYRLYEIDRIISRTLAYAIVTGLLIGVYTGLVLLATQVLKFSSPVAVAASTLVAAALFNPVRRRVQHAVDRRFNRARYDAEQMVTVFAARLQDTVDTDSVRADLTGVVHSALEPTHVSVWLQH
jgi:hypothetical protein